MADSDPLEKTLGPKPIVMSGAPRTPQTGLSGAKNGNLVILPDGTRHLFPAGTSVDDMHKALNLGPPPNDDTIIDKLRPFIAAGAGGLAAAGTALIPGIGESGVAELAADTQGYAAVDTLLKYASGWLGGKKPNSLGEALTDSEKDAAINAVAGKLVNGLFKGVKGFFNAGTPEIYKMFPTTSQALEAQGHKILATVPKFLEDYGVPASKAAALDKSGGEGFTQALAYANTINGRMAGTNAKPDRLFDNIRYALEQGLQKNQNPLAYNSTLHSASDEALNLLKNAGGDDRFRVLDEVIKDSDKLAKVLKVGQIAGSPAMNVKQDLAAYRFMKIVQDATTTDLQGGARINAAKLTKAFIDPKMASTQQTLFGKQGLEDISELFKNIVATQDQKALSPRAAQYLKYVGNGKWLLGIGALAHAVTTGNFMPVGALAGIQLSSGALGKMMTNPRMGRTLAEMAIGTLPANPTWTARMIGNALRNYTVGIASADGSVQDGEMYEDPQTGDLKLMPRK